jgi:hypothetical protein
MEVPAVLNHQPPCERSPLLADCHWECVTTALALSHPGRAQGVGSSAIPATYHTIPHHTTGSLGMLAQKSLRQRPLGVQCAAPLINQIRPRALIHCNLKPHPIETLKSVQGPAGASSFPSVVITAARMRPGVQRLVQQQLARRTVARAQLRWCCGAGGMPSRPAHCAAAPLLRPSGCMAPASMLGPPARRLRVVAAQLLSASTVDGGARAQRLLAIQATSSKRASRALPQPPRHASLRPLPPPPHARPRPAKAPKPAAVAGANGSAGGYRQPPPEILQIVDAPPQPSLSFSPDRRLILQLQRPPALPPILEIARPELKLAGARLEAGGSRARGRGFSSLEWGGSLQRLPALGARARAGAGAGAGAGVSASNLDSCVGCGGSPCEAAAREAACLCVHCRWTATHPAPHPDAPTRPFHPFKKASASTPRSSAAAVCPTTHPSRSCLRMRWCRAPRRARSRATHPAAASIT